MVNKVGLKLFLEEFFDGIKNSSSGGEYKEIYVNPTPSEMDEVAERVNPDRNFGWDNAWMKTQQVEDRYVRFTATPNKKVYVFSPWILHESLDGKFGVNENKDVFIHGIARKINDKWIAVEMHNIEWIFRQRIKEQERKKEYENTDWSWLDKYILTTPLYKKIISRLKSNPNDPEFKSRFE